MSISFSDCVRVAPDVLFRMVSDEAILVNLNTEVYLGLNPVGARMWSALNDAPSIAAAYQALLSEYDVEPERLRADLEELLGQLLGQKLIEVRAGA
jgi:coenzyme PQQ synthesis protein D (PqqD)